MRVVRQPEGSALCGQCCVAMVAGVGLRRAIAAVGAEYTERGTGTRQIVAGLRRLGVRCSGRLRRLGPAKPVLPARCIVAIIQYRTDAEGTRQPKRAHWMVSWNGQIYDPGQRWPEGFAGWKITTYLEIFA